MTYAGQMDNIMTIPFSHVWPMVKKKESSRSISAIPGYNIPWPRGNKNHNKPYQILHFWLILLQTFVNFTSNYLGN